MDALVVTLLAVLVPIILLLIIRGGPNSKRLPPGSLGLPIVGQSFSLLWAMRRNSAERWLEDRARRYGQVSKMRLFGRPTIFIYGQAANKIMFNYENGTIVNQEGESIRAILGDRCLLELRGEDHRRVRNALLSFLKPESLKQYVGKMDLEIRRHLDIYWQGKQHLTVLPLMKTLTFDIISSLLFGMERGERRDVFVYHLQTMLAGMLSFPINLPFTRYNRSLRSTSIARKMVSDLIADKRSQLEQNKVSANHDLITCLLSLRREDGEPELSETEIVQNVVLVMVAGHDTSSILITFILAFLANHPELYALVLQEQEAIRQSKAEGEVLTWEDLAKMKYTWRVAMETLRMVPPVFGGFRTTISDFEYGGYLIPKGWKVFWVTRMTHMDGNIFKEPLKFDPARFENQSSIPPYCYIPFGAGSHTCPGNEFARVETLITIHYIITRFTWKLNRPGHTLCWDPMPAPKQGLPIQIEPRKSL